VILVVTGVLLEAANVRDAAGHLTIGALTDPVQLLLAALLLQDYVPATTIVGIGPCGRSPSRRSSTSSCRCSSSAPGGWRDVRRRVADASRRCSPPRCSCCSSG
jgi:hypothetical protein